MFLQLLTHLRIVVEILEWVISDKEVGLMFDGLFFEKKCITNE